MTYESWRTVDAPLTDSRIMAMVAGSPVTLILWPNSQVGTRYVIEPSGRYYLTLTGRRDIAEGGKLWHFQDHSGRTWLALTKYEGANVATLTLKQRIG